MYQEHVKRFFVEQPLKYVVAGTWWSRLTVAIRCPMFVAQCCLAPNVAIFNGEWQEAQMLTPAIMSLYLCPSSHNYAADDDPLLFCWVARALYNE